MDSDNESIEMLGLMNEDNCLKEQRMQKATVDSVELAATAYPLCTIDIDFTNTALRMRSQHEGSSICETSFRSLKVAQVQF